MELPCCIQVVATDTGSNSWNLERTNKEYSKSGDLNVLSDTLELDHLSSDWDECKGT